MDDGGKFVCGSSTNAFSSTHGTVESTFPGKMAKFNIQHGIPSHSIKDEAPTRQPEVFVFGTNITASTPFTSFQSNIFLETKDSGRNLANEDIRSSTYSSLKNDKGSGPGHFVFSSSSTATTPSEGAAEHALQDETKKINISKKGPSARCIKVNDASTPAFLFQSKNEATAGCGIYLNPKVQESCQFGLSDHLHNFSTFENAIPSFSFTTINAGRENAPAESCAVKQDTSSFSRESLFGIDIRKSAYRDKTEAHKRTRRKKQPTRLKDSGRFLETEDSGRNLANEDIRSSTYSGSKNDKGSGPGHFVFSSRSTTTALSEWAAEHALQDETNKLNISREEPSVRCTKVNDASTPEFLFQSRVEATAGCGTVQQPKVQESCQFAPSDHLCSFSTFGNDIPSFSSTTINAGKENAPGESCALKHDPSRCSRESLFGIDIKSVYRDKKEAHKSTRRKKQPTRLKQHTQRHQASQETCSNGLRSDLAGDYSPMDCSPYQVAVEQVSKETSVSFDQFISKCDNRVSNQNTNFAEDLIYATAHLVIDSDLPTYKEEGRVPNAYTSENNFASSFNSFDEDLTICSALRPSVTNVNVGSNGESKMHATEACVDEYVCNANVQTGKENNSRILHESSKPVTFQPSSPNISGLNFTFGVSLSPERPLSTQRRNTKRRLRTKGGQVPKSSATQASVQPKASQDEKNKQFYPETSKTKDSMKEQLSKDESISAALETCETWRTSGNQAYGNGHFAAAEGCYTRGINSMSRHGTSGRCSRALMLCYSNRAAARMSLGRIREALLDCLFATSIDPTFLKAKVRAANCQLALGDLESASRNYTACLESNNTADSDIKMFIEASDGLERVKRVADWISQSKELLKKRTLPEATMALESISNALNISSHSDNLMEMKAKALLTLQRYEEVIELCQKTEDLAERNSVIVNANGESNNSTVSEKTEHSGILWRSYLICKSYFLLGKLDKALELLEKHEQLTLIKESDGSTSQQCFSSLSASIRQLLSCKAAGNESFEADRYSEAVEQYSVALRCSSDSRPFSAVCFCNRAAAYQALGQLTDAISDCSLAMVLDANYSKAISRRATLYEMMRDYGQSANDLRKLISLIEKQASKPVVSPKVINKHSDLKQARARLLSVENEAKDHTPLNLYLILGVEPSCTPTDIKKAYRKAALRHHPDKAAQRLVSNENADDGFWREIAKEVYADADHLFKVIGEAYNILSDPEKRQEYDTEENLRNCAKRGFKGMSRQRSPEQHYRNQHENYFNPRQWQSAGPSNKGARSRWSGYEYADDYW